MKTTLEHLAVSKQEQIHQITEIIKSVVTPEKIILFGSYATGLWVEDRYTENGILYEYMSDYDFLVVTKDNLEKEYVLVDQIVNRCRGYRTPVNVIIHDIAYINEGLSLGQYFFTEIIREGILLYDSGKVNFEKAKELTSTEIRQVAQEYFDQWFESASQFLKYATFAFSDSISEKKKLNEAAFLLHQATERFYNTLLLVFTGYKPKTHNLDKLRNYAKALSPDIHNLFHYPPNNKEEEHLFDLLKRAYVDARYKSDYQITEKEFSELLGRIRKMQGLTETICKEKIESFTK